MSSDYELPVVDGCPPGVPTRNNAKALWGFDMKMGGPATALSLFFLFGIIISLQLAHARNRNTYFMIVVVIAALAEGGGYGAAIHTIRESCKSDLFDSFLASQVIILLVPNLIEATMYAVAAKISAFGKVPRRHFWLRPAFLSWFYSISDVVTVIIQAIGIGIWGSARTSDDTDDEDGAEAQADVGAWIVVAGLILQIVSQSIFFLESLYIQWRMDDDYARRSETRALFFMVYWVWGFLQIRNIYRLVAFIQRSVAEDTSTGGSKGAGEIQPAFFTLEALAIVLTVIPFAVFPPGYLLPRGSSRKAEQLQDIHENPGKVSPAASEDLIDQEKEVFAPAVIPEYLKDTVLKPFDRFQWLGKVF